MAHIEVRRALWEDAQNLWQWRNDPVTREMFRTPDLVSWEDHAAWLKARLEDADTLLLVGICGTEPVGVMRFDKRADGGAVLSINVAPSLRARGIGKALLQSACAYAEKSGFARHLHAEIKAANDASRRIFEAVGFVEVSRDAAMVFYERDAGGA